MGYKTRESGTLSLTGADFSYGVGKDIGEAESGLRRPNAEREARGEIARGELRGIIIKTETATPELSTLQRLLRQPFVPLPQQQTEDTGFPVLLQ